MLQILGGILMAFFDELGKKISQTSQGVVQKTKDTAEVIKLNGMISDEEKRINNLYMQIGKLYFEVHEETCEECFTSMISDIKESKSKISQYSEQVKKLKGIVRCPNCGGDVQYGSPFCSSCGTKIEVENSTVNGAANVLRCSKCGMPIKDGCAFCTHCGTKVEETVEVEVNGEGAGDEGSKQLNNVIEQNPKLCPYCNNEVEQDAIFCVNCGKQINN